MSVTAQNIPQARAGTYRLGYADGPELRAVSEREAERLANHRYVASISPDALKWKHMYVLDTEMESGHLQHVRSSPEWRPAHYNEMKCDAAEDKHNDEFRVVPVDSYARVERELCAFELETRTQYRYELADAYRHSTPEQAVARFPVLAPMYDVMKSAAQFGQDNLGITSPHLVAFLERVEDRALDHLAEGKHLPSLGKCEVKSKA